MHKRAKSIYFQAIHYLRSFEILSGLENCHIPGLYSLVFKNRESDRVGMLRMFYCGPSCTTMSNLYTSNDFSVLPHTHRQDIILYRLTGKPKNVTLRFTKGEACPVHEYNFGSALLNGQFSVDFCKTRSVNFSETSIRDGGLYLESNFAHTVIASPGDSWVVEEKMLGNPTTKCYSLNSNLQLSSEGLYIPMTSDKVKEVVEEINNKMKLERRYTGPRLRHKKSDGKWERWEE